MIYNFPAMLYNGPLEMISLSSENFPLKIFLAYSDFHHGLYACSFVWLMVSILSQRNFQDHMYTIIVLYNIT